MNEHIESRLDRIETLLVSLVNNQPEKEYYSTREVAEILGKAEYTVREWCRQNRIWAEKRKCGRGTAKEWMISREEVIRIKNEGLLPI